MTKQKYNLILSLRIFWYETILRHKIQSYIVRDGLRYFFDWNRQRFIGSEICN